MEDAPHPNGNGLRVSLTEMSRISRAPTSRKAPSVTQSLGSFAGPFNRVTPNWLIIDASLLPKEDEWDTEKVGHPSPEAGPEGGDEACGDQTLLGGEHDMGTN